MLTLTVTPEHMSILAENRAAWLVAIAVAFSCAAQAADFTTQVQPVLTTSCVPCHHGAKGSGGLALDSAQAVAQGGRSGPVIKPGDPSNSPLYQRIASQDKAVRMPLGGTALPEETVALIRTWIEHGAPGLPSPDGPGTGAAAKHWAYIPPVRPAIPAVHNQAWVRNPVDAFILSRLEKEGLQPSPEASRETLIRRVSLDLIGIPPTPKEIDEFLNDARPDAYERLVERLLASPHYGERWAWPWLDLARYADTNGWEKDRRRSIWKYRDWVIDALNQDMPFDEFTIEQLAGDLLPNATTAQKIASGFNRNTLFNEEGGVDKDEEQWVNLVDRVNTTATAWLGSTIGCAQCHNHKFDPFTQKEYYQLLAFFNNSDYKEKSYGDTSHKYIEPVLSLPTPEQEVRRNELQTKIDLLETKLKTQTPRARRGTAALGGADAVTRSLLEAARSNCGAFSGRHPTGASRRRLVAGFGRKPRDRQLCDRGARPRARRASRPSASKLCPTPAFLAGGPGRDVYGNFSLDQSCAWRRYLPQAKPKPVADRSSRNRTTATRIDEEKTRPDTPSGTWMRHATRNVCRASLSWRSAKRLARGSRRAANHSGPRFGIQRPGNGPFPAVGYQYARAPRNRSNPRGAAPGLCIEAPSRTAKAIVRTRQSISQSGATYRASRADLIACRPSSILWVS